MATDIRRVQAGSYRKAQLAARARAADLGKDVLERVNLALARYASSLNQIIQGIPETGGEAASRILMIQATRSFLESAENRLAREIRKALTELRGVSYADVQGIWREATKEAAKRFGAETLLGRVRVPPLTILGAYENLGPGSIHWASLLRRHAASAAAEADLLIQEAILGGMGPDKLARAMRPYVTGAEKFETAFAGLGREGLTNLKNAIPSNLHGALGQVKFNAARIGFSEIHNARAEAEVMSFATDPFVSRVAWRLSPDRGLDGGPDECDALAEGDFYGLGSGMYPVHEVPYPPHPHDRCERVPIVRGVADAGKAKLLPSRKVSAHQMDIPKRGKAKVTAAGASRIRERTERVLADTAAEGPTEALRQLAKAAQVSR